MFSSRRVDRSRGGDRRPGARLRARWPPTSLVQQSGSAGCVTESGLAGECQDGRGLVGPRAIALSPDGENAYVADEAWDSVATLARDGGSGSLSPISTPSGCLSMTPNYDVCGEGRALGGARDVAVSPDGKNVYVAAPKDDAVAVLDRDAGDGHLTQSSADDGCVSAGGSGECGEGNALDEPTSVAVSPDGKNVYVASKGPGGGIAIFERDPETGDLSQDPGTAGCVSDAAAGCVKGLSQMSGIETVEVSPDGRVPLRAFPLQRHDHALHQGHGNGRADPGPGAGRLHRQQTGRRMHGRHRARRSTGDRLRGRKCLRRLGTTRRDPGLRPRRHLREADPEAGDRGVRQQHRPLGPDAERHRRGVRRRRRDGRDQLGRRPRRRVGALRDDEGSGGRRRLRTRRRRDDRAALGDGRVHDRDRPRRPRTCPGPKEPAPTAAR